MPTKNSDQEPKQIRGRFQKGQSGNPGGRPKKARVWKEQCAEFLEMLDGWDRLVKIARGETDEPSLPALRLMAEYAYGKPQQHVDVTSQGQSFIKKVQAEDYDAV